MSYEFTIAEQAEIRAAMDLCSGLTWDAVDSEYKEVAVAGTDCVPLYQTLSNLIEQKINTPGDFDQATLSDLKSAKLWLDVAIGANSGSGMHSAFIRAYTNRQGELRLGSGFSKDEMQEASNVVARNVANGLLKGGPLDNLEPWTVPRIDQIAGLDAKAIGEALFEGPLGSNDTAVSQNAGWSGTIGFNLLGGMAPFETWRLISAGDLSSESPGQHSEATVNRFDDVKNILFAVDSYNEALKAGVLQGAADLPVFLARASLYAKEGIWNEVWEGPLPAQIAVGLSSGNWLGFINDVVAGTSLAPVVSLIEALGVDRFFDMFSGVYDGTSIHNTSGQSFTVRAHAFFSQITAEQSQNTRAQLLTDFGSASDWASQASQSTADGEAMRNALKFLSPLVVYKDGGFSGRGLDLYNPETGLGSVTQEWIKDRSEMLSGLMANRLAGHSMATSKTYSFTDIASGEQLLASGVLNPLIIFGDDGGRSFGGALKDDRLYGGADNDIIKGYAGNDYIEGGSGNDILIGGQGNDTLVGGSGNDRYEFATGDGHDTLIDADGLGGLWIDEVPYTLVQRLASDADSWHSEDGKVKFLRSGSDLLVLYGRGDSILIRNYVVGALGLRLEEAEVPEVPGNAGLITGSLENDHLNGTAGDELILGLGGNDWVNYSDNQGGNDTIVGGVGSDRLFGGSGNDRIYAYGIGEYGTPNAIGPNGGIAGDWLDGRDGDDLLVGSSGSDGLFGGAGSDTILGGDGNDIILADTTTWGLQNTPYFQVSTFTIGHDQQAVVTVSSFVGSAPREQAGNDVVFAGEGNDIVDGYAGNDYLEGNGGHDYLLGGEGNDTLHGGEGNDTLYGDGFDGVSEAYPSSRLPGDMHGDDLLIGGDGEDLIMGNGGNDRLYGDQGNDTLIGDDRTTPAQYHGNDFLDGGANNDVLFGMGGDDTLYGGEGNDWLAGEDHLSSDVASSLTGNDWLYGGAGNDTLLGGNGNDNLDGGDGLDNLWGGVGNDTLNGGADADYLKDEDGENFFEGGSGDDTLEGGSGNDRYFFSKGDGVDFLTDREGVNSVIFGAGIERESLKFRQANSYDGNSYLTVDYEGGTINIENGMAGAISDFYFNDGSTLSLSTVLAEVGGLTLFAPDSGGQLQGSDARDILSGSLGNDLISAAGGNDHLYGNEGNDTLLGGAGDDNIAGGSGDDSLQGDAGNDTLAGGLGNDTLLGGSGDDVLFGGDGEDWLVGLEGNDTLSGGAGDDTLEGGAGVDTYILSAASGHDLIRDDDGEYSVLKLSRDIALTDLKNRREGNDLLIEYKDGSHSLRIESYYSASVIWEVADDDGRSQSMDAFLAELSESSSIDVGFWERKFQLQVQAAFAAELEGNGWELEGDGYFHYYSNGKTWEEDSARRAVYKEFSMSGELSYGYDDSYYYEVAETSESRSEYVRTTKTVHSVSPGGLFSSGGGSSFVSADNVQKLFSNQGGHLAHEVHTLRFIHPQSPISLWGLSSIRVKGKGKDKLRG